MKCMKKVALEFDEDNINRHPEGAEDGKGGQFAPKDGGSGHSFSEPKEINKEELDEDSDYRKDNPVKEDNVIRLGDPDEEWYDELETGVEYTQLSHIRDYFGGDYKQHFEGYNLFTRFDIKNKNGYEDDEDKTIGQLVKLYDDNGELIAEQRTGNNTGSFILSEKRLDENGEMTEIEYTDEEHGKNMRNFVPKYDKNYKDQREKWDKNEKEKGKIKEFMIEGKEIEDLKKEKSSMTSEIIKLNRKVDSAENDDEIRKYQDEILEINKKSGEIEEKIKEAKLNKKNDSHVQANMHDIAEVMNHIDRMKDRDGLGDINKFSREELLGVAEKLGDHDKKTLAKFFRMSDRVEADIKEGKIETMGKFGKNEYDEHSFVEMANSEIRNNRNLQKAEIAYKKYKTNVKSRELLYYDGDDEYLANEERFYFAVFNLQEKYGLDKDEKERLRKEAVPIKRVADMDDTEKHLFREKMNRYHDYIGKQGKPTEREQRLLNDEQKYDEVNRGGLKNVGENLEMHYDRVGNEVFTPLTAKNVHIYSVGNIEQDVKEHLYEKAKDFFPKNRWVKQSTDVSKSIKDFKGRTRFNNVDTGRWGNRSHPISSDVADLDTENRMHLQLIAREGKKFKVKEGGKSVKTAGNWNKNEQTIQVFNASNERPNGGQFAVDWIWEHELSHSHYDYLGDAIDSGKLKDKVNAYKTFNEESKKVDAGIIKKLMGSYASDYVVAYENGDSYGNNLETELYAGFTDVRYQKIHDNGMQMESYKAWHELARTYPKLMKAFEKLSGEGVGDTALSNVFSQENIGKSSSEIHDTETIGIDIGRNIVDFDMADYIIEKGYNEIGKLVSVKTLFSENVKAEEAFVEQEHPRDGDGQFTKGDGGSGSDDDKKDEPKDDNKTLTPDNNKQIVKGLKKHFGVTKEPADSSKVFLTPDGEWIQLKDGQEHWDVLPAILVKSGLKDKARKLYRSNAYLSQGLIRGGFEQGVVFVNAGVPLNSQQVKALELIMIKKGLTTDNLVTEFPDDSMEKQLIHKLKKGLGESICPKCGEAVKTLFSENVKAEEEFVEQEHPRDEDGKFTDKDGSNSRVERQKSILQQEIDYLKKSIKEESKKYRQFEKVSDEDRSIRGKNRNVLENIKELEEELNSSDTVGLPHIPLKPNTHEIETIDNGMYLSNSDSEPEYESDRELMKTWSGMKLGLHSLEGFKKGNSTIKVSIDIKEKGSYGISRETAEKQINLAKIMWNSLSDEERDSINNFTIEQKPSVKMVKNEKGEDVIDGESLHDSSILGYWQPSTNELAIRIDSSYKSQEIKGTFIHEVAHSMYHKLKDKHPERIKEWKKSVEKIPPTTKYGKYNLKRWKNGEKQFKELEANNWEWQEVVAKDSDGNVIRTGKWNDEIKMEKELIPKEDVEKLKSTALSNIEFYKDLYFNEIHSEVHMYMMGQQKRGHMKKTGKVTKGISKFIDPYRLLHDLPKMEEPLVVGEVEEDSPVMEVVDITESISEVVIYLDENFERVLTEDEGEYEFIIELNDDMTIKKYTIKSMWEKVEEAFVEQEHPRDGDGQFTDKGGGSTQRGKQEKPTYKKQKSNIDVGYISKKIITKYPQLPKDFVDQQIHESIELRENAGMANKELQNNLNKNLEGVIISGRVKEIESMVGKLARQPENFNTVADLHDVSGVRVMADNLDGINSSLKYIKDNYNVVEEKDNVEDHRDGYRGYHAIIEDESGVKSEIQIRTKTQDIWAKYVHERVYKPKNNKVKKYVNDNKETITSYIIGMSDYFHNSEKGVSIEKPDCPEELEIELGCM